MTLVFPGEAKGPGPLIKKIPKCEICGRHTNQDKTWCLDCERNMRAKIAAEIRTAKHFP